MEGGEVGVCGREEGCVTHAGDTVGVRHGGGVGGELGREGPGKSVPPLVLSSVHPCGWEGYGNGL